MFQYLSWCSLSSHALSSTSSCSNNLIALQPFNSTSAPCLAAKVVVHLKASLCFATISRAKNNWTIPARYAGLSGTNNGVKQTLSTVSCHSLLCAQPLVATATMLQRVLGHRGQLGNGVCMISSAAQDKSLSFSCR